MVKEKLRKALEDAVGYYNSGFSANDAIIKSASDNDLTLDQTDRVVESFNTAKTINYYDKNASDRTGKFDLASKKDVTLSLFGKSSEKKATVKASSPEPTDDSFYATAPDRSSNRKNVFSQKRAAFLSTMAEAAEEKWAHGFSDRTLQDMASDTYATIKSAEADIKNAIGTLNNYLWTATEKIAKELSKGPYDIPEDRADLFKVACPHPQVIKEVSKFSTLLKSASGGQYRKMNVVDTAPVEDLLKEAEDIMSAVELRKSYRQKLADFHDKAEKIKSAMLRDPSITDKIPKHAEDFIHAPTEKKAQTFSIENNLFDHDKTTSRLSDISLTNKSRKEDNEQLRDVERGAILADLLSSDPILQDADPRQVSAIYKSMVASSPRVSLNKEIVRSVLRSAVNSIAISPNDTKVLTDVDKGISRAYGKVQNEPEEDR